ncbi:hypothetical protein ACJ41O_010042 [Fusarium nematophilum]
MHRDARDRIGGMAGDFASQLRNLGSSRIYLFECDDEDDAEDLAPTVKGRREPDKQFLYKRASYAGLVVEVSFADTKDLRRIAQDYIFSSDGGVRTVVGINIGYRNKLSTASLWRLRRSRSRGHDATEVVQVLHERPFRSAGGQLANGDEYLTLNMSDLAPDDLSRNVSSVKIAISFSAVSRIVEEAQELQLIGEPHHAGDDDQAIPNTETKKHSPPPPRKSSSTAQTGG